ILTGGWILSITAKSQPLAALHPAKPQAAEVSCPPTPIPLRCPADGTSHRLAPPRLGRLPLPARLAGLADSQPVRPRPRLGTALERRANRLRPPPSPSLP